jgi:SPP1 gp7 family putative phage head morphogenesis protein
VRSRTIARTEMNGMVNGGTQLAYEQGGIEQKQWLSTRDSLVRDSHMTADGQVVNVGDKFMVGTSALSYPGDPAGEPGDVINCRCTVVPVI